MKFFLYGTTLVLHVAFENRIKNFQTIFGCRMTSMLMITGIFGLKSFVSMTYNVLTLSQMFHYWKFHRDVIMNVAVPLFLAQGVLFLNFSSVDGFHVCISYFSAIVLNKVAEMGFQRTSHSQTCRIVYGTVIALALENITSCHIKMQSFLCSLLYMNQLNIGIS